MANFNFNGVNLYYEVRGDKNSKNAIAFLNGVMASVNSWNYQILIFEKMGWKIILHDFKGQMLSDKPEGPYTFEQHAKEAKALFEYLGVEKVHLVGTSYGGEVGMKFSILFPEMTQSLSVINSVSELDNVLDLFISGWKVLARLEDGEQFFWGMAPSIYGDNFMKKNASFLEDRASALAKIPSDYFRGQLILYDTFERDVYMTDSLHKIKCPALVVCGQDDLLKRPKFSQVIADNILNSEYVLIPDCGHVTIFEKPEVLNSILLGFIMKNS
jgi:pimeloyl-ACP methyl ester carboxylesterase